MNDALLYSQSEFLVPYHLPFRVMFFNQLRNTLHYHDFEELVCVLKGEAIHECDDETYTISAGDIFLIRRGSQHAYRQCRNLLIANILFTERALAPIAPILSEMPGYRAFFKTEPQFRKNSNFKARLNVSGDGMEEIRLLIFKCEHECSTHPAGYEITAEAYFRQIITLIARNYQNEEKKYSHRMFLLSQMVDFIDRNYASKISREDIVRSAFLSVSSASRLFQAYMKKSMIEYLTEVRLQHAQKLLQSSEQKITDIARLCGFEDSNYFSLQFHRFTGQSPRSYRQSC